MTKEYRKHKIGCRVTDEEFDKILDEAEYMGFTNVSEYLRTRALRRRHRVSENHGTRLLSRAITKLEIIGHWLTELEQVLYQSVLSDDDKQWVFESLACTAFVLQNLNDKMNNVYKS